MKRSTKGMKLLLWGISVGFTVLFSLTTAAMGYIVADGFIKPVYEASSLIMVQKDSSYATQPTTSYNQKNNSENKDSSSFIDDCIVLFGNSPDMTSLMSNTSVKIEQVDNTSFIKFIVTSANPQVAANTANQLAEQAPKTFAMHFSDTKSKVDIITFAVAPSTPVTSHILPFALIGMAIGLIIGSVFSLIFSLLSYRKYKIKAMEAQKQAYKK